VADDNLPPPPRSINIFGTQWRDWLFRLYRYVLTMSSDNVPRSYTKVTSNTYKTPVQKGQLTKIALYPRIGNEHAESSREIQSTVTSSNIVGQIFRASRDNITALMLTLESGEGVVIDDFDGYANDAALQTAWPATGAAATLETTTYLSSPNSMSLPTTNNGDEWQTTSSPLNYTGYTGEFDCYFSHDSAAQQISVFIGDGTNTKSLTLSQDAANQWQKFQINEAAMTEDGGTTNTAAITEIGFRVITKKIGGTVFIEDLTSVPPAGDLEVKLWDMGTTKPVSTTNSIDDGTQYTKIGEALSASHILSLDGGKRLYHIDVFLCGQDKSIPTNELLNIDNYYLIELKYVDTDVKVYGPDSSFSYDYYESGYAFTAPDEATAITAIGTYNDIMFGVMSAQDIYILNAGWRFNAEPNGNSQMAVFLEDTNMKVIDVIIDHEHSPEQNFTNDVSIRPMFLPSGGKLEYYYNDDYSDSVATVNTEYQFLFEAKKIHG